MQDRSQSGQASIRASSSSEKRMKHWIAAAALGLLAGAALAQPDALQ
jgi:hypothetical protein